MTPTRVKKAIQHFLSSFFYLQISEYKKIKILLSIAIIFGCFMFTGKTAVKTIIKEIRVISLAQEELKKYVSVEEEKEVQRKILVKKLDTTSTIVKEIVLHVPTAIAVILKDASMFNNYATTMGFTFVTIKSLKFLVKKQRPDKSNNESFPSGHAALSALGAVFTGVAYSQLTASPLYLLSLFSGTMRVLVGKHSVLDVFAGWCIGIICAIHGATITKAISFFVLKKLKLIQQSRTNQKI